VQVETVGTSGTIAGCVRKFLPDLEDHGEAPRKR
jgi:RNase P/RNase MRP subunit POP5